MAKENIDKHFALKKHAEFNYKLTKEKEELQKELKELKANKTEKNKLLRQSKIERVHFITKNGFYKTVLSTGSTFYRNWFRVI